MTAAHTSFLLLLLARFGGHVVGETSPRQRCPLTCECGGSYSHPNVACINSYLTDIPLLPVDTWRISISGNNITRLRAGAFSELHKLTKMRIYRNNILSIDERAFEELRSLDMLHLFEEYLSSFENGVFRFLTNLTTLSMRVKRVEIPQREICLLKHLRLLKLAQFQFSTAIFHPCFEELTKLKALSLSFIKQSNMSRATFHPFRTSLTVLHLVACELRRLNVDMFNDLSKLVLLDLSQNKITSLPSNIFASLTHLTGLNIAANKLKVISSELLRPLRYLRWLNVGFNAHVNMTVGEEFLNMTRLQKLVLSGVTLTSLNNDTFRPLRNSPLVELDITTCFLRTISKGAFRPLRNLTVLALDFNPLNATVLRDAFYGLQGKPLRELRLSSVNLHDFSPMLFEGLGDNDIRTITFKASHITTIKRGFFRNLRRLSKLDLTANKITTMEDHSLEDLVSLSYLHLDNNNIVELRSAKRLSITPGLSLLSLCRNSIKEITEESLLGYGNLTSLLLAGNNIRTISANAFAQTPRLKVLGLFDNKLQDIRSGTFDALPGLSKLLLYRNDIQIKDPLLFQRLHRLTHLDISQNAYFGRMPVTLRSVFQNMPSLQLLNLHGCEIDALPVGMFTNTTQLTTVVLSDNAIKSWIPDVFAPLRRLRLLTLARNKIVSVNVASFSHLTSLRQLDLSQNPFACNCDLIWFLEYVHNNNIFVIDIARASWYTCSSPKSLHGVPVLRVSLSPADCVSHTDLVVTLSTAAAIVSSAIVFTLVYRCRWYIRYYFFLIRSRRRRYLELADGHYKYDAFVAHSSDDRVWVVKRLLPRLEADGHYRLCLHQRDWVGGRLISENIVESIEASRKVIVVLSNNFAQSRWCQVELAMASNRRLSNWRNSLVLVLLETISPENQNATLRCLLTTHTYLEWNERAEEKFWQAMRKALRRPPGAPPIQMRSIQQRDPRSGASSRQ